jgi:hypothetical protein
MDPESEAYEQEDNYCQKKKKRYYRSTNLEYFGRLSFPDNVAFCHNVGLKILLPLHLKKYNFRILCVKLKKKIHKKIISCWVLDLVGQSGRSPSWKISGRVTLGPNVRPRYSGKKVIKVCSVTDPDPGSGAFWTPGSGIRGPRWVKNQDSDPGSGSGMSRIIFPRA